MRRTFDTTGWTQEEVNLIPAALCALMHRDGFAREQLRCRGGVCDIRSPEGEPSYTPAQVKAFIEAERVVREENERREREEEERERERDGTRV